VTTLKCHPFPVLAHFDRVVALSFAFPQEVLRPLVPEGLEIDTYGDMGFVTLAMVWTRGLRPAGFPEMLGRDFFLAGYRIFTRLEDEAGRSLRGLKIIRSETDSRFMVWSGNLMTGYNYLRVGVEVSGEGACTKVVSRLPGGDTTFEVQYEGGSADAGLPEGSPFPDWRSARRFAGPMPFTFSPSGERSFVVVEGKRGNWKPEPIAVNHWKIALFDEKPFQGVTPILANAFAVGNIDYRWEKGRVIRAGGLP